jgi:hypothetical protein
MFDDFTTRLTTPTFRDHTDQTFGGRAVLYRPDVEFR